MKTLDAYKAEIDAWDPDQGDLPDELALAMDASEELAAHFDARFARWQPSEPAPVPDGLPERVLPRPRRAVPWRLVALPLAAALPLAVIASASVWMVRGDPEEADAPPDVLEVASLQAPERAAHPPLGDGTVSNGIKLQTGVQTITATGAEDANGEGRATSSTEATGEADNRVKSIELLSRLGYMDGAAEARPAELENQRGQQLSGGLVVDGNTGDLAQLRTRGELRGNIEGQQLQRELDGYRWADKKNKRKGDALTDHRLRLDALEHANPADGNTSVDHGVNGFVETRSDPLSTFAIDVDTASFTLARRQLLQGFLPAPESVRVEEFVNFPTYSYPPPDDGPFAVQFEASPSPWGDHHLVRVGVQGRVVSEAEREPVHLTFLVDTSGSMSSDDKLGLVKRSLGLLASQLTDGDTVALVAYAGSAGLVLPPTPATDQQAIQQALAQLSSGGSTAMGAGIELAYRLADQVRRPGHVNRVIIASDGDANVGTTDTAALTELISGYARRGITLTTLGFGTGNYRDHRMEQLANDGDGNYYYIDSEREARRIFVDQLTSTLQVVARDVKIQVEFSADSVERYRLLGYENRDIADADFRVDAVDAGEIGAGHQVTALYVVQLTDHPTGDIATVRVRAKPPGPDAPATERSFTLPAYAMQPSVEASSADHRLAVATAALAERLRHSPYTVGIRLESVARLAEGAARPDRPEDAELVDLIHRAAALERRSRAPNP